MSGLYRDLAEARAILSYQAGRPIDRTDRDVTAAIEHVDAARADLARAFQGVPGPPGYRKAVQALLDARAVIVAELGEEPVSEDEARAWREPEAEPLEAPIVQRDVKPANVTPATTSPAAFEPVAVEPASLAVPPRPRL